MAKSETLVRCWLEYQPEGSCRSIAKMNVYLDAHPELQVGKYVELVDDYVPNRRWKVVHVFEEVRRTSIKHGWNNNI